MVDTEKEVCKTAIDPRFAGIDYDHLNKEVKDMRRQIERLQAALNKATEGKNA